MKTIMIHSPYQICSGDQIRRMRWVGQVACIGGEERCIQVIDGETRGKRPLGRPRHGWTNLQELGCGVMDGVDLAQDKYRRQALVNMVMNLRAP
jgi:hypothetical protein